MNMKNQMIIIINDKETLAKIAEDQSTELRIKNSLVDSIVKRVEKKCSHEIKDLVESQIKPVLIEGGLASQASIYARLEAGYKLRELIKGSVGEIMENEIHCMVYDEVKARMDGVAKMISDKVNEQIKKYNTTDENINGFIRAAVNRYVERRLQIKD